jgi:hypothetical protein
MSDASTFSILSDVIRPLHRHSISNSADKWFLTIIAKLVGIKEELVEDTKIIFRI